MAALVAAIGAVAASALGASAAGPPPQGPDLATMGLAVSDFAAGASVQTEGFRSPASPAVAEYDREFRPGLRLGGVPIFYLGTAVYDFGSVGTASVTFDEVRKVLNTRAGRRSFVKSVLAGVRISGVSTSATVSAPVSMGVGHGAFRMLTRLTFKAGSRRVHADIFLVLQRLDRAVGETVFTSYPGKRLPGSVAILAAQKTGGHFQQAFTVRNLTPPSVGGTPLQGQMLSANAGTWAGAPSGFTYQWGRCDAAGASCAPIAGATGDTYVVGSGDKGARINVTVTAANSVTTTSATASATAPVG